MSRLLSFLLALSLTTFSFAQDPEPQRLTLESIFASPTFYGDGFNGGRWADEGPVVTYIANGAEGSELVSYNLETDEQTTLIGGLTAPDTGQPFQIEGYAYTADGTKALLYTDSERVWRLNTKGYYYVYDVEAGTLTPLGDRDKGFQMFAKFCADGSYAAFVRDRNLFAVDLSTMEEIQLTSDGADGGIINGTSDWVYEEEFGLRDAWRWSPTGHQIAFLQLDESATRDFAMADLRGQYPDMVEFRYPKAGETNSEIRAGVIDVPSGDTRFFDTGTWKAGGDSLEYLPQMGWTPSIDGTHYVWMFRLNRDQTALDVLYGDPSTMAVDTILEERSDVWIDAETGFSDLDVGQITYLDDEDHFVWVSETDGYRHIYLYRNTGELVRQITSGEWDITDFHGTDGKDVFFTATIESPTERQLYRFPLKPKRNSQPERITEGAGWHNVNPSADLRYYIDQYSNVTSPATVSLHRMNGDLVTVLEANDRLKNTLAEYALPTPEFTTVPAADGTPLNAMLIKPSDFDPNREYPLLMFVYGGPGSQTVRNSWGGQRQLWHTMLAENHDILVATVDNRGTGARGNAFKTITYKQLGVVEAEDQIAAAQHMAEQSFVDADRIGIWGWSYGGFMTLNAMLMGDGPETFAAGVSVAPVTDWRQYDTIYTERFMSTPQKNPDGYRVGSPITYADRLADDQELLIVHGDLDDNVHFQNAIQMANALIDANKQFDFFVYPGRNHGIYGGTARINLYTKMTNFWLDAFDIEVPEMAMVE